MYASINSFRVDGSGNAEQNTNVERSLDTTGVLVDNLLARHADKLDQDQGNQQN